MSKPILTDVADTALWVAVYRAQETERPDALFLDPLAGKLAGERGREIARVMTSTRQTAWNVVMRTVIIDEYINRYVREGKVDTILNLGAGLDTRPYRLEVPNELRWIEVDQQQIIDLKEPQLAQEKPKCQLERARLNLADRALRKEFFAKVAQSSSKILVLTEGVLPYLTPEQVAELAEDLRAEPSFLFWIVDYISPKVHKYIFTKKRQQQMQNAPFLFLPKDWYGFFAEQKWEVREERFMNIVARDSGRRSPIPWIYFLFLRFFLSEKRKEEFLKMSGYFVLEPER